MKLEVGQIWQRCLPQKKFPTIYSFMFEITKLTNTKVYVKYLDCPWNRNLDFDRPKEGFGKEHWYTYVESFQTSIKDGYLIKIDGSTSKTLNDCLTSLNYMCQINKVTLTDTQLALYDQCIKLVKDL